MKSTLIGAFSPMIVTLIGFGWQAQASDITGTWQADTPDGPQTVVVRADSSASFGEETVRWRVSADTVYIQFGDEWVGYNFELDGDLLTLSGGDLEEPITLRRVGTPSTGLGDRLRYRSAAGSVERSTR
jgi:hypothetical protein